MNEYTTEKLNQYHQQELRQQAAAHHLALSVLDTRPRRRWTLRLPLRWQPAAFRPLLTNLFGSLVKARPETKGGFGERKRTLPSSQH